MEIARFWRLNTPTKGFRTQIVGEEDTIQILRYPGGEIALTGDINEVENRLKQKGFNDEAVQEILFSVFGTIATEATVTEGEVIESLLKFLRSEVGEEDWSKVELGVNRLPR